ncbi:MAG: hypothetical protein M3R27_12545 [Bacteroidota bacterium]|nr:hypothetical protein [Bacteroidota bacterium]
MITAQYLIFAASAIIDSVSSRLTINNIVEDILASKMPIVLPEGVIVIGFERDLKSKSVASIKLVVSLNDKPLGENIFDIDFNEGKRNRTLAAIPPLPISEPGKLRFEIFDAKKKSLGYCESTITVNPKLDPNN